MSTNQNHQPYDPELADRIKADIRKKLSQTDESNSDQTFPQELAAGSRLEKINSDAKHGGLGDVLCYVESDLGRNVAVKFTRRKYDFGSWNHQRFEREVKITSLLDHPGVVPVFHSGETDGRQFYSMRFIAGQTMKDEIAQSHKDARFTLSRNNRTFMHLIESFRTVCATIEYAHQVKKVWHRDLKPANIMMDGRVTLVVDWGLAKFADENDTVDKLSSNNNPNLTSDGQVLGTPYYMSPEQAEGKSDLIDHRTDIYGLGATLYEILTGHPPHQPTRQLKRKHLINCRRLQQLMKKKSGAGIAQRPSHYNKSKKTSPKNWPPFAARRWR